MLPAIALSTNTLAAGGAERQRVLLANELARRGHPVTLYCLQRFGPLADSVAPGVHLERRDYRRGPARGHDILITGTTNTETAFALVGRARTRGSLRWLVVVHNPVGDGAPPLAGFARTALERSDGVAGLSRWHAEQLRERWGLPVTLVLGNGVDPEMSDRVRAARTAAAPRYDVGYLGRLSTEHKGLDTLLTALAEPAAASLTLAVAGDGPDEEELKDLARRLGVADRVRWLGHQAAEAFLPTVGVLALLSRYEAAPMAALEARAAGVPIVATPAAGVPANAGLIVPTRQASDVARALAAAVAAAAPTGPDPVRTVGQMTDDYLAAVELLVTGASSGRLAVLHVGNDPAGSGGIATAIRTHLRRRIPGIDVRGVTSYAQDGNSVAARHAPAVRAGLVLLSGPGRRRLEPTVVHVHLSQRGSLVREGALALLAAGIRFPLVVTLHGSRLLDSGPAGRAVLAQVLRRADLVHGFAEHQRQRLRVPAARWRTVPNDVEVPRDRPVDKTPVVLFAGEVGRRKGVDVLLAAWERAAPTGWSLVIAGPVDDELLPVLRDVLDRRDDVTLLGPLAHDIVLEHMERASVLVQPARSEAFPIAVCEALAHGCAVIGTDVGALGELLRRSGQWVVQPDDGEALAAALRSASTHPDEVADRGAAAHRFAAECLATSVVTDRWASIYRSLPLARTSTGSRNRVDGRRVGAGADHAI